jgi:hypothetical protein
MAEFTNIIEKLHHIPVKLYPSYLPKTEGKYVRKKLRGKRY